MKAVTTGHGVSGILADNLEALVDALRNVTGDQAWHIHLQLLGTPVYFLRVYAPDRHSQEHSVPATLNTVQNIRDILANEAKSWVSRVRSVAPDMGENTID